MRHTTKIQKPKKLRKTFKTAVLKIDLKTKIKVALVE